MELLALATEKDLGHAMPGESYSNQLSSEREARRVRRLLRGVPGLAYSKAVSATLRGTGLKRKFLRQQGGFGQTEWDWDWEDE